MLFYATKQTIERLKIKMPNEMQLFSEIALNQVIKEHQGDELQEWGLKLFYFDRRKCIQVMNFASKLTILLIDVKLEDVGFIPNRIAHYLLDLYKDDKTMVDLLDQFFNQHSLCVFSKLTNRSIISSLNHNQTTFLNNGDTLFDYLKNGVLHTKKINHDINFKWLVSKTINGKLRYILAGEHFKELMMERYRGIK